MLEKDLEVYDVLESPNETFLLKCVIFYSIICFWYSN